MKSLLSPCDGLAKVFYVTCIYYMDLNNISSANNNINDARHSRNGSSESEVEGEDEGDGSIMFPVQDGFRYENEQGITGITGITGM